MTTDPIGEEFLRLALAIDQHLPGYIDAYYGPSDWKTQAEAHGKLPLDGLKQRAAALATAIEDEGELDEQRRDFLARHVLAMQTSLRLLSGEEMSLADETELIYGVRPTWTDESVFEEARRELDGLLTPGGDLPSRLATRNKALEISIDQAKQLLPSIREQLREMTRRRFPLPDGESFDIEFVSGQPWNAYNWYLGGGRSRIEINTDLPLRIDRLVQMIAHEAYPGHHTELSTKDQRLVQEMGRLEHRVVLLNSPSCIISEGIATNALSVIMPEEALAEWYAEDLFPRAGLTRRDASSELAVANAMERLSGARDNAAFMLHDRGASDTEVIAYLQRQELRTEAEARKSIDFIRNPLDRSYIFTYSSGRQLLRSLFEVKADVTHWFTRLLTEPVTPSQVREWMQA